MVLHTCIVGTHLHRRPVAARARGSRAPAMLSRNCHIAVAAL